MSEAAAGLPIAVLREGMRPLWTTMRIVVPRRGAGGTSQHRPGSLRLSIATSFLECEAMWRRAVEQSACTVFQTFDWLSVWQDTIGDAERVSPYLVRVADDAGHTVMLLPLGVYRVGGLTILGFLGGKVSDYHAPVVDPEFARAMTPGAISQLWKSVLGLLPKTDVVWLRHMPPTIDGVHNPLARLAGARHRDNAHSITLPQSFAEYTAARDRHFASGNRRYRRRLGEQGVLECREAADAGEAAVVFKVLARQKSRRWCETGAVDLLARPGYRQFYERMIRAAVPGGRVHAYRVSVDDEIVATHWGVLFRDRLYGLMMGWEAGRWTRFAPARVMLDGLVAGCIADPEIAVFDMTVGDERYKHHWIDTTTPLFDVLTPRTPNGMLFVLRRQLRHWCKRHRKLANRLRVLLGRNPERE